jgi:hypothetical protein
MCAFNGTEQFFEQGGQPRPGTHTKDRIFHSRAKVAEKRAEVRLSDAYPGNRTGLTVARAITARRFRVEDDHVAGANFVPLA